MIAWLLAACESAPDYGPDLALELQGVADANVVHGVLPIRVRWPAGAGGGRLELRVDDELLATVENQDLAFDWNTTRSRDGEHVVTASFLDGRRRLSVVSAVPWVSNEGTGPDDLRWASPLGASACGELTLEMLGDIVAAEWITGGSTLGRATQRPFRAPWSTQGLAGEVTAVVGRGRLADGRELQRAALLDIEPVEDCDVPPVATLAERHYGGWSTGTIEVDALDDVGVTRCTLWVDGAVVAVDTSWPWFEGVRLEDGAHDIGVLVEDTGGQSFRTEAQVVVDGTPPEILLLSPGPGETVRGVVEIEAEVVDASAATLTAIVDGEGLVAQAEGRWSFDSREYAEGEVLLSIEAIDAAGNAASLDVPLVIDQLPEVVILEPAEGAALDGVVLVSARARDAGGTATLAVVTPAGLLGIDTGGTILAPWDACASPPGAQVLVATATDLGGNWSEAEVHVRVAAIPEVEIDAPAEPLPPGALVTGRLAGGTGAVRLSLEVDGVVRGRAGVVGGAEACGLSCPERCDTFAGALDTWELAEGSHELAVVATDLAGNVGRATTSFRVETDQDGDGHVDVAWSALGDDCDDDDPDVRPSATEACDGLDNDCNGATDEGFDDDGDGYGDGTWCPSPADCDDADPAVNPSAVDTCDLVDNDCDGFIDAANSAPLLSYVLGAPDRHSDELISLSGNVIVPTQYLFIEGVQVYVDPGGVAGATLYILEEREDVHIFDVIAAQASTLSGGADWHAFEIDALLAPDRQYFIALDRELPVQDYVGENLDGFSVFECDGHLFSRDEGANTTWEWDDTQGTYAYTQTRDGCNFHHRYDLRRVWASDLDQDGDAYTPYCGDCDDEDETRSPIATEACDWIDQDCDGAVDEDFDADADGYGDCNECDDGDATVNPDAAEACDDATDQDCDGFAPRCQSYGAWAIDVVAGELPGSAGREALGSGVALADFDDDGDIDLAVGAPGAEGTLSNSGIVSIWYAAGGGRGAANASLEGPSAGAEAGAVLDVGDLGGDGIDDLALGAPAEDTYGAGAGAALLRAGSRTTPLSSTRFTFYGATAGDAAGAAVCIIPDLNTSSRGLAIGAPGRDDDEADAGELYIVSASKTGAVTRTGASYRIVGMQAGGRLGSAITEGDIDGDGNSDIVVGEPGAGAGAAYLFEGISSGDTENADLSWSGEGDGDELGASLAFVGDVDGDGLDDLALAAPTSSGGYAEGGTVYLVSSGDPDQATPSLRRQWGSEAQDHAGATLAPAGDVDGDGFADVLVGAPEAGSDDRGAAWLAWGPWTGGSYLDLGGNIRLDGRSRDDVLGTALAGGADVDGDGYDDFVLGSPGDDATAWDAGSAWLFTEIP